MVKIPSEAIGLERDGRVVAGILFEDWNGASIFAHMAIRERITRKFLWAVADYVFRQLGCRKMIAPVASTNTRMAKLAVHLGFVLEAIIADADPDGDTLVFTMTKAQCRFLGGQYSGKA